MVRSWIGDPGGFTFGARDYHVVRTGCLNMVFKSGGLMRLLKRAFAVLALAGFFFASVAAQEKFTTPLIPREVLFGNPERADPQISPDGTQLGYLAPVDGVLNVWIRTLGKADDRAVTADKHRGIRNFLWQYDNRHILYTQDLGGTRTGGSTRPISLPSKPKI